MFVFGVSNTIILKVIVSAVFGFFIGLAQASRKTKTASANRFRVFLRHFLTTFSVATLAISLALIFVVPLIFYLPWLLAAIWNLIIQ